MLETFSSFVLIAAFAQLGWSATPLSKQAQASAESATKAVSSAAADTSAAGQSANIRQGTKISTELMSNVDARNAKVGDQVKARVTRNVKEHGQTVIHKGDTLVGHVTSVQSGAASSAGSNLGIQFDQLVQGNSTMHLNTVLSSIVSARGNAEGNANADTMDMPEMSAPVVTPAGNGGGGGGGRGGLLGGVGSTVGSTAGSVVGAAGSTLGRVDNGVGNTVGATTRTGVGNNSGIGLGTPLRNIHLQSQASANQSTGMNSMLSTKKGDLQLESGTQMEFRVAGESSSPHQHQ